MKITDSMIHPELRSAGSLIRKLFNFKNEKTFFRVQALVSVGKKIMKTRKLKYREKTIRTPDNEALRLCIYSALKPQPEAVGWL